MSMKRNTRNSFDFQLLDFLSPQKSATNRNRRFGQSLDESIKPFNSCKNNDKNKIVF